MWLMSQAQQNKIDRFMALERGRREASGRRWIRREKEREEKGAKGGKEEE